MRERVGNRRDESRECQHERSSFLSQLQPKGPSSSLRTSAPVRAAVRIEAIQSPTLAWRDGLRSSFRASVCADSCPLSSPTRYQTGVDPQRHRGHNSEGRY
jgi:hypothetical protein